MIHFRYSDSEIEKILKTLTIVMDSREQQANHITNYLHQKDIPLKIQKLDTGDYTACIPKNEELGISRDIYLDSRIERKASVNEIVGNLGKDERTRFENELIRSQHIPFTLLLEDVEGYKKIINGEYHSKYNPLALLGSLNTFKARYNFEIVYLDKKFSGNFIYYHFYYQMKNYLKRGAF